MANVQLPTFRYHPDPVATGSIVESTTTCTCCGQARGWIYDGPIYGIDEDDADADEPTICPWCIADGSAHGELGAEFTDEASIGGDDWDEVPETAIDEVAHRTPGFTGWQQERWWTHCGDAGQFLGRKGQRELTTLGAQAIAAIRGDEFASERDWQRFFAALDADGSPTAYLFRCGSCGAYGGYHDAD
jgi:uncharacterized protein